MRFRSDHVIRSGLTVMKGRERPGNYEGMGFITPLFGACWSGFRRLGFVVIAIVGVILNTLSIQFVLSGASFLNWFEFIINICPCPVLTCKYSRLWARAWRTHAILLLS